MAIALTLAQIQSARHMSDLSKLTPRLLSAAEKVFR